MAIVADRTSFAPHPLTERLVGADLHDLAEALERCPAIAIISTPRTDLGLCERCAVDIDFPSLDAVAVVAHASPEGRFTHRDEVCPGHLDTAAREYLRVAGNSVWIELPLDDTAPSSPANCLPFTSVVAG
jgi:hypothetical protein